MKYNWTRLFFVCLFFKSLQIFLDRVFIMENPLKMISSGIFFVISFTMLEQDVTGKIYKIICFLFTFSQTYGLIKSWDWVVLWPWLTTVVGIALPHQAKGVVQMCTVHFLLQQNFILMKSFFLWTLGFVVRVGMSISHIHFAVVVCHFALNVPRLLSWQTCFPWATATWFPVNDLLSLNTCQVQAAVACDGEDKGMLNWTWLSYSVWDIVVMRRSPLCEISTFVWAIDEQVHSYCALPCTENNPKPLCSGLSFCSWPGCRDDIFHTRSWQLATQSLAKFTQQQVEVGRSGHSEQPSTIMFCLGVPTVLEMYCMCAAFLLAMRHLLPVILQK